MYSNLKFTEFPVFPMVTYDRRYDSPVGAKWKIIVSIPSRKLKKPPTLCRESKVLLVGDWVVVVWPKHEKLTGHEANEAALYEDSRGSLPPNTVDLGEAHTRAIWVEEWATLIEVRLEIDMQNRRRYSGAIVEGDNAIQIWIKL